MPKLTPKKLSELAHRRQAVMDTIKELTAEKAQIDAQLELLDPGVPYEAGDLVITRTPIRALDAMIISKKFPPAKRPEFYKLALDTAEFKKHFSAIELEDFQTISYRTNVREA